jgi:HEAT repeat protein
MVVDKAASALGAIGPSAKDALPALRSALSEWGGWTRIAIAWALISIEPPEENDVPRLLKALENENEGVRTWAAIALGGLGDQRAIQPLRLALRDPDKGVREAAERALQKLGWAGPPEPVQVPAP